MAERENIQVMEKFDLKSFDSPDEVREVPNGRVELVKIGESIIGRATLQPGWKWSESVKPIVKTEYCEASHFEYQISGVLHVRMEDGTEFDCHPGEVCFLPAGHDAWVIGNEPVVIVDFQGMQYYAERLENEPR
jgi:hypothetical protein